MPLTLCTLNLNGIRSADRRGFSRWLTRKRPDILCVQELRASVTDVEDHLRSPEGWNARWSSAVKKGYAGVGIFSRDASDRYTAGTPFDHCRDDARALRADFGDLSVISLYVPSGSSSPARQAIKIEFLAHLEGWLQELLREGRPIAICADVNIAHEPIDLARPRENQKNSGFLPEERAWLSRVLGMGWIDVVRARNPGVPGLYSFWSNRGRARENDIGWRIDYVLATPELAPRVTRAWIEKKANLSDHAPVWVEIRDA